MKYAAGLDFGTSGARIIVIDGDERVVAQAKAPYGPAAETQWVATWQAAIANLFEAIPIKIRRELAAIALNGTSATVLLCDKSGIPLTEPLLYNDARGNAHLSKLMDLAPAGSPALSATSSLVKLLWWRATLPTTTFEQAHYLMHQADWLSFLLHGQPGISDYHNALKLGYDVGALTYPDWLLTLGLNRLLPQVQAPGTRLGQICQTACDAYDLPIDCAVIAGTTDSIAAFLASGARYPGEAVTSLGSTLVLKVLSETRVDADRYGIYSHRLGGLWLAGGASNTGGKVLQQFFTPEDLKSLSQQISPTEFSGLDYYPLCEPGERFPISDPSFQPRLSPRPATPQAFLHGLLEGIARIEAQGYQRLQQLGTTALTRVLSAGGGAENPTWTAIRQRHLPVPIEQATSTEAAYGTARLALQGVENP